MHELTPIPCTQYHHPKGKTSACCVEAVTGMTVDSSQKQYFRYYSSNIANQ